MRICLDTNVLIDLAKGKQDVIEKLKDLPHRTVCITSITVFEFLRGSDDRFVDSFEVLELDGPCARTAAGIFKKLEKSGKKPSVVDTLIASCCISNRVPLLTRDRSFEGFKKFGLELKLLS